MNFIYTKKIKIQILLLFIFSLSSIHLYAQKASIQGKINSEGKPLELINIGLVGTQIGTFSQKDGNFLIKNIPIGSYTLRFSAIGFETLDTTITIIVDKTIFINIELKNSLANLNEVLITETPKEIIRPESPIPTLIYTSTFFKKNPTPNLFESLQNVNGVRPQLNCSVCNTGDIHINGMEGPYTMITIDGMPIVSSLSTVYGLMGIPTSMIDRIEIVKGPASVIYGPETIAGLINIRTKSPSLAPTLFVDVMGTSYQELNTDFAWKKNINKSALLLSGNYFNFQKRFDINHDNFTDITLQHRFSGFGKLNTYRKKNRLNTVAARFLYEDRFGGEMQWEKKFRGTDSLYAESIYTKRIEVIGDYQLPINQEKIIAYYSFNSHIQNSYYGTTSFQADQKIGFAQLIWEKDITKNIKITSGTAIRSTYYLDNTASSRDESDSTLFKPQFTFLPGVFIQNELTINPKNKLLFSLRYDYHSIHKNIFTPRLNYKYSINPSHVFRLSLGNGYRIVNIFTEDHAALTGARTVVIKEKLKPEQSWNGNMNYNGFIDFSKGFIGLDASIFYTYFSNKIIGDFLSNSSYIIYDNLEGYAICRGASLNIDVIYKNNFKILGGITYTDLFRMDKNNINQFTKIPQLQTPKWSGTFSISYTFPKIRITIDYTGSITGSMHLPVLANDFRSSTSPWFTIQNIQLTKEFSNGITIYGGIKNLLNFLPINPLIRPFDPFNKQVTFDTQGNAIPSSENPDAYTFDTSYNYAPLQARRFFIGVKYILF